MSSEKCYNRQCYLSISVVPSMPPAFPSLTASRPIWAEIDRAAWLHNLRALHQHTRTPLLCVIKADGYGHGALGLAQTLAASTCGTAKIVKMLGVASVDEGITLRNAGIKFPILLLSAILPQEAAAVVEHDLTPTVFTPELAQALENAAARQQKTLPIHVKIDTGMHRLGVPHQNARDFLNAMHQYRHLQLAGIYTHFASADEEAAFTQCQRQRFVAALPEIEDQSVILHAANSAAALQFPDTRFAMIRTGIATYGLWPGDGLRAQRPLDLQPVMNLRARITHLETVPRGEGVSYGMAWRAPRESKIAIVPAGYADGYPRRASGHAQVLINGRRCAVVGRVTMDQILVDVTKIATAQMGDLVTLWGRDGESELSADEVASWAQTIGYEIVCGVAPRVPRVLC